jgi:RNA polymerase sigma factor (TIGR02999 family)
VNNPQNDSAGAEWPADVESTAGNHLPVVYAELRKLASSKIARLPPGQTLQPTELVHEAWMRLVRDGNPDFKSRTHFFAAAAQAMRHVVIDGIRRKQSARRGGGQMIEDFPEVSLVLEEDQEHLLAIDEALDELAVSLPVEADLVKLRFFVGMTMEEAAEALQISQRTADRYWAHAKAWLFHRIKGRKC